MVGCCSFGPCKKKRTYEFNNAATAYDKNDEKETYRASRILSESAEDINGEDPAKLQGYAIHPNGELDLTETNPEVDINGVVAVDLDSRCNSVADDSSVKNDPGSSGHENPDVLKKDSKRSSRRSNVEKAETGSVQSGTNSHQRDGSIRSSGATPYPDDTQTVEESTSSSAVYTNMVTHQIGGNPGTDNLDGASKNEDDDKENSDLTVAVDQSFDFMNEGTFHSEHSYQPDIKTSDTTEAAYDAAAGAETGESTTEAVQLPDETEQLDNMLNDIEQVEQKELNGYKSITHVTTESSVVYVNGSSSGSALDAHDQLY